VDTDQNLLFGVLALELELIDIRQFAEVCCTWAAHKDKSLADLLVGRTWLNAEDRTVRISVLGALGKMKAADALKAITRHLAAEQTEREAAVDDERPVIAGVLYNRLRTGMRLQCDATVQYALGKHKSRLLYSDLKVKSPYNTYLHAGLPPGPICSPSTASMIAALRPAKHDYLFYVARGGGRHQFTRTYEEHLKAIEAIRGGQGGRAR